MGQILQKCKMGKAETFIDKWTFVYRNRSETFMEELNRTEFIGWGAKKAARGY